MRRVHAGELHVLVNNVGTAIGRATLEYSPADVQMVFATNLGAAFHLSQACHPLLKASGDASILFMSSTAGGPLAMRPAPVYAMTKGAPALARRPDLTRLYRPSSKAAHDLDLPVPPERFLVAAKRWRA